MCCERKLVRSKPPQQSEVIEKIFYNRETIRGIRTSTLAETPQLYHDWPRKGLI